jgi:hypothetical protein
LEINIPSHAKAEVTRQHNLKDTVFVKTRLSLLCLILVLVMSIGTTLAYLAWTANQTPNRTTSGQVALQVVENGTTIADKFANKEVDGGIDNKLVQVKSSDAEDTADEVVRVTFVPEVASKDDTGNVAMGETWSEVKTETVDDETKSYVETDLVKLYLTDDWSSHYIYKDGVFYYNKAVSKDTTTENLLSGAVLQDDVNKSDYGDVKVNVIADAIQSSPQDAPKSWGVEVSDDDDKTVSFITE